MATKIKVTSRTYFWSHLDAPGRLIEAPGLEQRECIDIGESTIQYRAFLDGVEGTLSVPRSAMVEGPVEALAEFTAS